MAHNNLLVVLVDDDLELELRQEVESRSEPVEGVHVVDETDPLLAVEDALQTFPADEILLVEGAEHADGLEASLQRYGLPVTRVS